jgi:hypothetical protein
MKSLSLAIRHLLFIAPLSVPIDAPAAAETVSLPEIRRQVLAYVETAQVPGKPLGFYRDRPGTTNPPSLYAACDVAHIRTVMGEDLQRTLTAAQRQAWIDHINSFARPDGTYGPAIGGHTSHHANGMVIGALGALGGQQLRPVQLYDAFDTSEEVGSWLETVDWRKQWGGSHLFWGGMPPLHRCMAQERFRLARCQSRPANRLVAQRNAGCRTIRAARWRRAHLADLPASRTAVPVSGASH